MIRKAEKEKKHDAKKHVKYRKKDWYVAGFCFATIIGKAFKILTNWSHFKIPCLQKQFPTKAKSNYRGSAENPATQKFYIHFILYTLSCPKLKSGQLKVYKLMFALELSMKK